MIRNLIGFLAMCLLLSGGYIFGYNAGVFDGKVECQKEKVSKEEIRTRTDIDAIRASMRHLDSIRIEVNKIGTGSVISE